MSLDKAALAKCPACERAVSSAVVSCPQCGHPFGVPVKCPQCGKPVSTTATSCPHCGRALSVLKVPKSPSGCAVVLWAVGGSFVLLFAVGGILSLFTDNTPPPPQSVASSPDSRPLTPPLPVSVFQGWSDVLQHKDAMTDRITNSIEIRAMGGGLSLHVGCSPSKGDEKYFIAVLKSDRYIGHNTDSAISFRISDKAWIARVRYEGDIVRLRGSNQFVSKLENDSSALFRVGIDTEKDYRFNFDNTLESLGRLKKECGITDKNLPKPIKGVSPDYDVFPYRQ